MDDRRFDDVARIVASGLPRRAVGRLLAGGTLGAVLARLGIAEADARCVKPGRRCKRRNGQERRCCDGAKCRGKTCKCPSGREACGRKCCGRSEVCVNGACLEAQGSCQTGDDNCASDVAVECVPFECICVQTMAGKTRCAGFTAFSECGQCTRDRDCRELLQRDDAFCARDTGAGCNCATNEGICVARCPEIA